MTTSMATSMATSMGQVVMTSTSQMMKPPKLSGRAGSRSRILKASGGRSGTSMLAVSGGGHDHTSRVRRWCVLTYADFKYFTSAEKRDRQAKGAFPLDEASVNEGWELDRAPRTPHVFTVRIPERDYYFCCPSDESLGEWLDAFNLALGYEDGEAYDDGDVGFDDGGGAYSGDDVSDGHPAGRRSKSQHAERADTMGPTSDRGSLDGTSDAGSLGHIPARSDHGAGAGNVSQTTPFNGHAAQQGEVGGIHTATDAHATNPSAHDTGATDTAASDAGEADTGAADPNSASAADEASVDVVAPTPAPNVARHQRTEAPSVENAADGFQPASSGKQPSKLVAGAGSIAALPDADVPADVGLVKFTVVAESGSCKGRVWTIVAKEEKAARYPPQFCFRARLAA